MIDKKASDRFTIDDLRLTIDKKDLTREGGVAQSFPLLETLRPFLREEPQSLKGKTLRYPATRLRDLCASVVKFFEISLGGAPSVSAQARGRLAPL